MAGWCNESVDLQNQQERGTLPLISMAKASQLLLNYCSSFSQRRKFVIIRAMTLLNCFTLKNLPGQKHLASSLNGRDFPMGSNDTMFGVVSSDPLLSSLLLPIDSLSCKEFMMSIPSVREFPVVSGRVPSNAKL